MERLSGRRQCSKCGKIYHIKTLPPAKEGICNACGAKLYHREDDKPEVIGKRLRIYNRQTAPLIKFYRKRNILKAIDANPDPEQVFLNLKKALEI